MKMTKLPWLAVWIALTVVGGFIKIPAIVGSVAFDSFPALMAAVLIGGIPGAIVGGVGHLVSALIGGMPLGPFHVIVAVEMAVLVWGFGYMYQKGMKWGSVLLFVVGNAFVAPLPFIFLMSKAFYVTIVPSLLISSILNTILALVIAPRLVGIFRPIEARKTP